MRERTPVTGTPSESWTAASITPIGNGLAGEIPHDGAELRLGVEAEAVVDPPDRSVEVHEDVTALAVGVVQEEVQTCELAQPDVVDGGSETRLK